MPPEQSAHWIESIPQARTKKRLQSQPYALAYFSTWRTSYIDVSAAYSAGCLYSTVRDLYKWQHALRNGIHLSEEIRDKMLITPDDAEGRVYRYGWFHETLVDEKTEKTENKNKIAWHGGGIMKFRSRIEIELDRDRTIILLQNSGASNLRRLVTGISIILTYGRGEGKRQQQHKDAGRQQYPASSRD